MALATVGSSVSNTQDSDTVNKEWKIPKDHELRVEVEGNEKYHRHSEANRTNLIKQVIILLKQGLAEIFGTELMKGRAYTFFKGSKIAVYTWHGCTLEIEGQTANEPYIAQGPAMTFYINIHGLLEQMRNDAVQIGDRGPVVLVAGQSDVGKSTLVKILLNYAVRKQRTPIMVDLDVGQNAISVPGTIGLNTIELPADPETGFTVIAPLIYHYGSTSPSTNLSLYKLLIGKCAEAVKAKFEADKKVKYAGAVINTCGWVTQGGYQCLQHAIESFRPDVVLVIEDERTFSKLKKGFPDKVRTVLVPKSGGVVVRNKSTRAEGRDFKIREYFYGTPITVGPDGKAIKGASLTKTNLYPLSFEVRFDSIKIFQIGEADVNFSLLPIGMKPDPTKLTQVTSIHSLKIHQLLSISSVEFEKESTTSNSLKSSLKSTVVSSNILGVICITNIDTERGVLTVLSPQPRPLPQNGIFITSDVLFIDSQ